MIYLLTNLTMTLEEADLVMIEMNAEENAVSCGDAWIDAWLGEGADHLATRNYLEEHIDEWMAELAADPDYIAWQAERREQAIEDMSNDAEFLAAHAA